MTLLDTFLDMLGALDDTRLHKTGRNIKTASSFLLTSPEPTGWCAAVRTRSCASPLPFPIGSLKRASGSTASPPSC